MASRSTTISDDTCDNFHNPLPVWSRSVSNQNLTRLKLVQIRNVENIANTPRSRFPAHTPLRATRPPHPVDIAQTSLRFFAKQQSLAAPGRYTSDYPRHARYPLTDERDRWQVLRLCHGTHCKRDFVAILGKKLRISLPNVLGSPAPL